MSEQTWPMDRRGFLKAAGLVGAAAAGGTWLSACSSSSGGTSGKRKAPTLVKPKSKITLNLWTWAWPTEPQATQYTKAFEAAVPEVKLNVNKYTQPDYLTALKTALPNGKSGDVLHMTTGSMLAQYAPLLAPLESLAAKSYGSDWASQFISGSVKEIRDSVKSSYGLVALPQEYSVGGVMWANSVALSGISGNPVPQSYQDMVAMSKALNSHGRSLVAWGAKDQWPNTDYLVQFASQWSPGIVERAESGAASFTDPAIVDALKFMQQTLKDNIYNKAPFASTAFPGTYDLFNGGKAYMTAAGTWYTGELYVQKSMTQMTDAFLWPHIPDAPEDNWLKSLPSGSPTGSGKSPVRPWRTVNAALSMRANLSDEKAWAAWKFIEYWCGSEGQKVGAQTYVPARAGIRPPGLSAQWQKAYDWQNSLAPYAERREFTYDATRTAIQTAIANVCVNGADAKSQLATVDAAASRARKAAGH